MIRTALVEADGDLALNLWEYDPGQRIPCPFPLGVKTRPLNSRQITSCEAYEQRRSEEYRRSHSAVTSVLSMEKYVDTWTTENAIEFIHESAGHPLFLWYGLCNPHGPVDAPEEYATMYNPQDVELSENITTAKRCYAGV